MKSLNEQVSRIKNMMGLNEDTTTGLGYGDALVTPKPTQNAAPTGETIPMPNPVPPADQAIANELHNNAKTHEDIVKIIGKIKTPQQFLNVSNGIKIAANHTTYGLIELINAREHVGRGLSVGQINSGPNPATKQITDYLTKIGVYIQSMPNGDIVFKGIKPTTPKQVRQPDPNVVKLQQQLKAAGYDLGTSGPKRDGIDGFMGPKTRLAKQQLMQKGQEGVKKMTQQGQQVMNNLNQTVKTASQLTPQQQADIEKLKATPDFK